MKILIETEHFRLVRLEEQRSGRMFVLLRRFDGAYGVANELDRSLFLVELGMALDGPEE